MPDTKVQTLNTLRDRFKGFWGHDSARYFVEVALWGAREALSAPVSDAVADAMVAAGDEVLSQFSVEDIKRMLVGPLLPGVSPLAGMLCLAVEAMGAAALRAIAKEQGVNLDG